MQLSSCKDLRLKQAGNNVFSLSKLLKASPPISLYLIKMNQKPLSPFLLLWDWRLCTQDTGDLEASRRTKHLYPRVEQRWGTLKICSTSLARTTLLPVPIPWSRVWGTWEPLGTHADSWTCSKWGLYCARKLSSSLMAWPYSSIQIHGADTMILSV